MPLSRLALTITVAATGQRTEGVLVGVLGSDLDALEAENTRLAAALAGAEARIAAGWKYAHTHAAAGTHEGSHEPCCVLACLLETALAVGGPYPPDAAFDMSWVPDGAGAAPEPVTPPA